MAGQGATADSWVHRLAHGLGAQVLETPISWVLLARDLAFKLKKPVRLPFVDYSTPARRKFFCEEEVRLNRRLAPALYLGVSRVTGSSVQPTLDGPGAALDYAVRMRRFPPGALFSERLAAGTLIPEAVDQAAARLAAFHDTAPRDTSITNAPDLEARALAALDGCAGLLSATDAAALRDWLAAEAQRLRPLRAARRAQGCVREGHGDLHLANLALVGGEVVAFDCIEFDPALRWIDILDDASFTLMDFAARGRPDLGWRFLNGWLEATGDYEALPALRFSVAYRALVRAQVEHLRAPGSAAALRYAALALAWSRPAPAHLCITHGLPGSGKTFASQQLLERQGAVRIRSDVERKRLAGLARLADSRAAGIDLYDADTTRRTYQRLLALAGVALRAGFPVVLDAAFLRRAERLQAQALADELHVPFAIVDCKAPLPLLRRRLLARRGDASEANVAVLDKLRGAAEPLRPEERPFLRPWRPVAGAAPSCR